MKSAIFLYYNDVQNVRDNTTMMEVHLGWRGARANGVIMHHQLSRKDGLANIFTRQIADERIINIGGDATNVRQNVNNRDNLNTMIWERGDAGIPHPAEFIYTGQRIGIVIVTTEMQDDFFLLPTHIKNARDLTEDPHVHITFNRHFCQIRLQKIGNRMPKYVKVYTNAHRAFIEASARMSNFHESQFPSMDICFDEDLNYDNFHGANASQQDFLLPETEQNEDMIVEPKSVLAQPEPQTEKHLAKSRTLKSVGFDAGEKPTQPKSGIIKSHNAGNTKSSLKTHSSDIRQSIENENQNIHRLLPVDSVDVT